MAYEVVTTFSAIKIRTGDDDGKLGMKYNIGSWVAISDDFDCLVGVGGYSKEFPAGVVADGTCKPPNNPHRFRSYSTAFGGDALSEQSEQYRMRAVHYFADYVLADYLVPQSIYVPPDREIEELLGGKPVTSLEDLIPALAKNPALARKLQCVRGEFDPESLTVRARTVIYRLLKNPENLASYLEAPAQFVDTYPDDSDYLFGPPGDSFPEIEREALILAAQQRPLMVQQAFDQVELGAGPGDGFASLLVGFDRVTGDSAGDTWAWVHKNLTAYAAYNEGIVPAVGYYVTDAQLRYAVIAGPGVSRREMDFLVGTGTRVFDYTDGSVIDRSLADLLDSEREYRRGRSETPPEPLE